MINDDSQTISNVVIRVATESDVPSLVDRQDRLVDARMLWEQRLGGASDSTKDLCLIAEVDGRPVGHLLAGSLTEFEEWDANRQGAAVIAAVWWKLRAIAVEPSEQRRRVGAALLSATLDQIPRKIAGIMGTSRNGGLAQ